MGYSIVEGGNESGFVLPKLEIRGRKKKQFRGRFRKPTQPFLSILE